MKIDVNQISTSCFIQFSLIFFTYVKFTLFTKFLSGIHETTHCESLVDDFPTMKIDSISVIESESEFRTANPIS